MPQTFYIENDEEIISVIGRLRHSSEGENYFIFPKRSLVLQSIINLRLFQREAEKLGKRVVIVTQDETGLSLAEKAGLATERYTDDFSRKKAHLELVVPSGEKDLPPAKQMEVRSQTAPKSEELGSSDFYASSDEKNTPASAAIGTEQVLRVRNASPPKQTSLNSARLAAEVSPRGAVLAGAAFQSGIAVSQGVSRPMASGQIVRPENQPERRELPRQNQAFPQGGREERLKNFFSNERKSIPAQSPAPAPERRDGTPKVAVAHKSVKGILLFLGGVSLLSLLGVLVFLFLPRAEIRVVPYKTTQSVDLQFDGRFEGVPAEDDTLLVRVIEKDQEVVLSVDATGTSLGTMQKARGSVVIYNKYSADPQPLVATTRLETPEGKMFRLVEGVTVPGMVNGQPGATEATVIADQPGVAYNIAGTTFTIPGFKGSPKYDKFSAQSSKVMAGGSDATGTDNRVISKDDLEKTEILAKEMAKKSYLASVAGELAAGERVLEESLDITPLGNATLPLAGTVATSFEYKNTFKVRGFLFSEDVIKEKIITKGEETLNGVLFRPTTVTLSYGEAIPDYEGKKVRLKVHAVVDSESVVDQEKLLAALLGKDGDGVNAALTDFPEVKKLQILFKPQWFTSVVPSSKGRVTVLIEPGSAE